MLKAEDLNLTFIRLKEFEVVFTVSSFVGNPVSRSQNIPGI